LARDGGGEEVFVDGLGVAVGAALSDNDVEYLRILGVDDRTMETRCKETGVVSGE